MPAGNIASAWAQMLVVSASAAVAAANTTMPIRVTHSLLNRARMRVLVSAPMIAPAPKQPSKVPNSNEPPSGWDFATSGSSAISAEADSPKADARVNTRTRLGDSAT